MNASNKTVILGNMTPKEDERKDRSRFSTQQSGNTFVEQLHFDPVLSGQSSSSTNLTEDIGQGCNLAWVS